MGIDVAMLTGDNPRAAGAVARQVGITHVLADVSPDAKLAEVARLQHAGQRVAMVGDGVNDAAALVQADLGIAMGTGVGAAIEAADISVVSGDLRGVARALRLARETYAIVLQNLGWAFGYNLIALPLAITGLLSPTLAAAAMGVSSVTVVLNSLRLRSFGRPGRPTPVRSRGAAARGPRLRDDRAGRDPRRAGDRRSEHLRRPLRSGPHDPRARRRDPPERAAAAARKRRAAHLPRRVHGQPTIQSIAMTATSSTGARATVRLFRAGPAHFIGQVRLTRGEWPFQISGADGARHALGGSFTIPIS